jgi:putative FmdB family regulatory protein
VPTYQYRCTACDHQFEAVQSFSDASLTTCPACSGALRKVFSSVGIVFKGSGFYRTDSRSGSGSSVTGDTPAKNGAAKGDGGGDSNGAAAAKSGGKDSGSGSSNTSSTTTSSGSTSTPAAAAS